MNNNYYRITGYCPENDFSFILDSNGKFEKLWRFSSYLIKRGLKVIEVGDEEKFLDINISKAEPKYDEIFLRATGHGKPKYKEMTINGTVQRVVVVGEKSYVPEKV